MGTSDSIRVHIFDGAAAVLLTAGDLSATFIPELGMLGASLRWGDHEYLSLHGGLISWTHGHTTGLPLLYPWANRLSDPRYVAAGRAVDVTGGEGVHLDGQGLPIHGTLIARRGWTIRSLGAGEAGPQLEARFPFAEHPELLATFPFPHDLHLRISLGHDGDGRPRLRVRTTVQPAAGVEVPVSFGWHPYFVLPGIERAHLQVSLPPRRRLDLDGRGIPTGAHQDEPAEVAGLADRTFDDHFELTGPGARFELSGGDHRLAVIFDEGYPYAQLYAPERKGFVAIEPMTATVDALHRGGHPVASPDEPFTATFTVTLG